MKGNNLKKIFAIIALLYGVYVWFKSDLTGILDLISFGSGVAITFYILYLIVNFLYRLVTSVIPKSKESIEKENSKYKNNLRIKPIYVEDIKESFYKQKSKKPTLKIANSKKPEGAFIVLDKKALNKNKTAILNGRIRRDDVARKNVNVLGFNSVQKFVVNNNNKEYLYHRTHLLPFRYTLSEGDDVDGLLFTGTSHLNSGNRPLKNYKVPKDDEMIGSNKDRENSLHEKIGKSKYITNINVDSHSTNHYSLDDIERLVDSYIENADNSDIYSYGVFCNYEKPTDEVPSSVTAILRNIRLGRDVFEITIPNTH